MLAVQPTRRRFAQLCMAAAASSAATFMMSDPAPEPNPEIQRAMKAVTAAIPKAESDPNRPVYHFHPPANWNNDPNGMIWYKGWYHLFYQHNPYAAVWGHMHWGHARTKDLVNWEHLPVALWPSLEKGEDHVFSGGAILAADERPRIIYTSIGKRDPEQWLAIPKDDELIEWEKYPGNPIATLKIHGNVEVTDWRDPFLLQEGDKTYMVCGGNINARKQGGGAAIQLYEAAKGDLTEWKYRGIVFEYRDRDVINIECPNLFRMGTKWVLLMSPDRSNEYFIGDLDLEQGRFHPKTHGILDPGSAYATNLARDDKGRVALWYWGKTDTDPAMGWNGCMTMPRVLSIDEAGFLQQNPLPEFQSLRGEVQTVPVTEVGEKPFPLGQGDCAEIHVKLTAGTAKSVGLRVRGETEISFEPKGGMLSVGNVRRLLGRAQPVRLHIFLDKRVMEVYANDGDATVFTVVNAGPGDLAIEGFARGGTGRLESFERWPLKPAQFSLDRFKA